MVEAALYLISQKIESPSECYIVSSDHEALNTYAGVWAMAKRIQKKLPVENIKLSPSLPVIVPHLIRQIWNYGSNRGDVIFSSQKLLSTGYKYPINLEEAIRLLLS